MTSQKMLAAFMTCIAVLVSGIAHSASPVECIDKLRPELVRLLASTFTQFHVPKLAELDQDGIRYDLNDGGDGCLAVANEDYDGDGLQDTALLLAPRKVGAPKLVVAMWRGNMWRIFTLPTFCDSIDACYVKSEKPGTYLRSEAIVARPTRRNEYMRLTSRTASVLSGRLESTGIVYVFNKGVWRYVWVSD